MASPAAIPPDEGPPHRAAAPAKACLLEFSPLVSFNDPPETAPLSAYRAMTPRCVLCKSGLSREQLWLSPCRPGGEGPSHRLAGPKYTWAVGVGGSIKCNLRPPEVEPGSQAWEACMMPLHYRRFWAMCRVVLLERPGSRLVPQLLPVACNVRGWPSA